YQYNTQKSLSAFHSLLSDAHSNFDLLLIQEPYIAPGNSLPFSIRWRRSSTSLSARSVILYPPVASPSPEISAVKIHFPPFTFIFVNVYNAAHLMSETLNALILFIQQLRREYASIENFLLY
ncbi:hypothetical protein BT69DRAFT_1277378, partial [Atractiella rhizophila]